MSKKVSFFFQILLFFTLFYAYSKSSELKILPLKKPNLTKETIQKKISKNIIKPKKKPLKISEEKLKVKDQKIEPQKKPSDKEKIVATEKATETKIKKNKIIQILPKNKPLIVKKEQIKMKKTSKFYKKKDFEIAEKAIALMKKKNWSNALSVSKKAQDKSIYRFIQWKHLLANGSQASFYDYQQFIVDHKNYPRINRLKYLAEHKYL